MQIGAVEPRGVDADQHLAGSRPGIGVLGDDHLAVADGDRTHGGRFWQGRPDRLHDRFRYTRQKDGSWSIDRLAP